MVEIALLLAELMQHGLKTIAFCKVGLAAGRSHPACVLAARWRLMPVPTRRVLRPLRMAGAACMPLLLTHELRQPLRDATLQTRKLCELVSAYTQETLKATAPHLLDSLRVRMHVLNWAWRYLLSHGCALEVRLAARACAGVPRRLRARGPASH